MRAFFLLAGILASLSPYAAVLEIQGTDSAAIARAIQTSSPSDTVSIPEGTYLIDTTLTPRSGTHLIGAGQDKTILRFTGKSFRKPKEIFGAEQDDES